MWGVAGAALGLGGESGAVGAEGEVGYGGGGREGESGEWRGRVWQVRRGSGRGCRDAGSGAVALSQG